MSFGTLHKWLERERPSCPETFRYALPENKRFPCVVRARSAWRCATPCCLYGMGKMGNVWGRFRVAICFSLGFGDFLGFRSRCVSRCLNVLLAQFLGSVSRLHPGRGSGKLFRRPDSTSRSK